MVAWVAPGAARVRPVPQVRPWVAVPVSWARSGRLLMAAPVAMVVVVGTAGTAPPVRRRGPMRMATGSWARLAVPVVRVAGAVTPASVARPVGWAPWRATRA